MHFALVYGYHLHVYRKPTSKPLCQHFVVLTIIQPPVQVPTLGHCQWIFNIALVFKIISFIESLPFLIIHFELTIRVDFEISHRKWTRWEWHRQGLLAKVSYLLKTCSLDGPIDIITIGHEKIQSLVTSPSYSYQS